MPFSSLLTPKQQRIYTLLGKYPVYSGQNNLIVTLTIQEKTKILTQIVKILLDESKKVLYVNTAADEETLLMNLVSEYTGYSVRDLNNSNFREKPEVRSKIEELSQRFEGQLTTMLFSSPSTVSEILSQVKKQLESNYDLVVFDKMARSGNETDYAKSINIAFEVMSEFTKVNETPVITLETLSSPEKNAPAYLLNKKNSPVLFVDESSSKYKDSVSGKDFKTVFSYNTKENRFKVKELFVDPPYDRADKEVSVDPPYNFKMDMPFKVHLTSTLNDFAVYEEKRVKKSDLLKSLNQAKKLIIDDKNEDALELIQTVVSKIK